METLSDFVDKAVEFLVGGMLFTMSVAFLISSGSTLPSLSDAEISLLSTNSTLVAIVFVAVAYAMGVVGESLARSPFEFLLDRMTVRTEAFCRPGVGAPTKEGPGPGARSTWRNRITEFVLGGEYTSRHLKLACAERERQRAIVMTCHVSLHAEVQGQLKRLRLERVFSLSLAVTAFSLAIRGQWQYAALGLVSTACMFVLVNSRLKRFCAAIERAYKLVVDEKLIQVAQGLSTSAPGNLDGHGL